MGGVGGQRQACPKGEAGVTGTHPKMTTELHVVSEVLLCKCPREEVGIVKTLAPTPAPQLSHILMENSPLARELGGRGLSHFCFVA